MRRPFVGRRNEVFDGCVGEARTQLYRPDWLKARRLLQ